LPSADPGHHRRLVAGSAVAGVGALTMGAGLFGGAGVGLIALGTPLVFVGVAILGPVLARPLSRFIGWPLPKVKGMPGTLARENAMRNPSCSARGCRCPVDRPNNPLDRSDDGAVRLTRLNRLKISPRISSVAPSCEVNHGM
jgi:hypothetical protein